MEIEVQDLVNANIPKEFIDVYLPGLEKLFEGREISELKALISGDSLTNSHKRLLAEYTKQEYCKAKKVSENEFEKVIGEAMTVGVLGGVLGGLSSFGIEAGMKVLGFGATGIVRTSVATAIEATISSVEGGSLLAAGQSIGVKSVFLSPSVVVALIAVGAGIGLYFYFSRVDGVKKEEEVDEEKCSLVNKERVTPGY